MKPVVPILAALAVGLFALAGNEAQAGEEGAKPKKPKKPRPGQPTPGGNASIPGVPSIPNPPNTGAEPPVPNSVLARMVAAIATGNATEIRRVAAELEREGFPQQAQELRAAADALEAANALPLPIPKPPISVVAPPPNAVPVPKPPGPPPVKPKPKPTPGGPPPFVPPPISNAPPIVIDPIVTAPPIVIPKPPILVTEPPPNALPVPTPPAAPPFPVGAIPDKATLAGKTALMLWESSPGPVRDVPLLTAYKKSVGLKDPGHLYGPGTAKSLMVREIVPPTPWDWPSNRKKFAKDLHDNYKFKATRDPARREEWLRAAAELKPLF